MECLHVSNQIVKSLYTTRTIDSTSIRYRSVTGQFTDQFAVQFADQFTNQFANQFTNQFTNQFADQFTNQFADQFATD